MGDRNAGIGETADPSGNAGHDAERDRGAGQCQSLLSATPEYAGIAALQTEDAVSAPCERDQPGRNVGLTRRRSAAPLAGIFPSRIRPRQSQDSGIDQRVVNDLVRPIERVQRQG